MNLVRMGFLLTGLFSMEAAGQEDADVGATRAANFEKEVLTGYTTDPMELDVAADGRVFFVERAGAVKVWDPATREAELVGYIPVYMVIEDGLLGLALDPDFMENGWLYVFYAPEDAGPSRLSRFTVVDNKLDHASEKIMLEVPYQREECCHAAGSLAFDADGNLYLSTGDNTDPNDREGSPIDERPGRAAVPVHVPRRRRAGVRRQHPHRLAHRRSHPVLRHHAARARPPRPRHVLLDPFRRRRVRQPQPLEGGRFPGRVGGRSRKAE